MKTFDQCAVSYIKAHRGSCKSAKDAAQWESTLANICDSIIRFGAPLGDVDMELGLSVLRPIWGAKTETAVRLLGRIESILDWATLSKYRQGENRASYLENLFAIPNKIAPVQNRPALPWQHMPDFMVQLIKREGVVVGATQFAVLTACRSGEVRGVTWSEIDLEAKLWVIPAQRMKAGKEHRVPLSGAAIAFPNGSPRWGVFVFPGRARHAAIRPEPDDSSAVP